MGSCAFWLESIAARQPLPAAALAVASFAPASAFAHEALDQEIMVSATLQRDRLDVPSLATVIEGGALRSASTPRDR
jgi:hypothetical protein